jgi:hypothetical protein
MGTRLTPACIWMQLVGCEMIYPKLFRTKERLRDGCYPRPQVRLVLAVPVCRATPAFCAAASLASELASPALQPATALAPPPCLCGPCYCRVAPFSGMVAASHLHGKLLTCFFATSTRCFAAACSSSACASSLPTSGCCLRLRWDTLPGHTWTTRASTPWMAFCGAFLLASALASTPGTLAR